MSTIPNDHLLQTLPPRPLMADTRWRVNINPAPNCPRCASSNTKFCYYNNYSLAQPRFFCKGCRRYWTKGGSLRNVPVGGGCRKSRRSRASKTGFSSCRSENNNNNSSPNSSSSNCSEFNCPDIDMAAVFAKFLNPGQEKNNDVITEGNNEVTPNTSSETSYDSPISGPNYGPKNGFDYQKQSDDFLDFRPSVIDHKQLQLQEVDQEGCYITPDLTSFDDILEDCFWLEDSNNSSHLSWHPGTQMQEFNSTLPPSEECNSTTNLFSGDNWSYFDITGFNEILSDHDS